MLSATASAFSGGSLPRGGSKSFRIVIENDGLGPFVLQLKGSGAARGYTIKYVKAWRGTHSNITTAVKKGTYMTPTVPKSTRFLRDVIVKLSSRAARKGSFIVKASSMPNHPVHAVKGIVDAK